MGKRSWCASARTLPVDNGFSATGTIITHAGFRRAYVEDVDDDADRDNDERRLPSVVSGEALDVTDLEPAGHETSPPPRFTEASLVKKLEELGVGRPSTYASIMTTIQDRGYVWKKGSALVPTLTAFSVVSLLEEHFPDLVDYAFTAAGDNSRDCQRVQESVPWLSVLLRSTVPGSKRWSTMPRLDRRPLINRTARSRPRRSSHRPSRKNGRTAMRREQRIRDDMAPDRLRTGPRSWNAR